MPSDVNENLWLVSATGEPGPRVERKDKASRDAVEAARKKRKAKQAAGPDKLEGPDDIIAKPNRTIAGLGDLLAGQAARIGAQRAFVAANVLGPQAGGITDRIANGIDKMKRNSWLLRDAWEVPLMGNRGFEKGTSMVGVNRNPLASDLHPGFPESGVHLDFIGDRFRVLIDAENVSAPEKRKLLGHLPSVIEHTLCKPELDIDPLPIMHDGLHSGCPFVVAGRSI